MNEPVRKLAWPGRKDPDEFLRQEWLVTNGLGGYASGTIAGIPTRRFHGALIAALPAPFGRVMMLNHLGEALQLSDGRIIELGAEESTSGQLALPCTEYLAEFRLEMGVPIWRFEIDDLVLEKRIVMPYQHNTVHISYELLSGNSNPTLLLQPEISIRPHEGLISEPWKDPYTVTIVEDQYEIRRSADFPPLRLHLMGRASSATFEKGVLKDHFYTVEARRGYDSQGVLWSPGRFRATLGSDFGATFIASTESWETILAVTPEDALSADVERKSRLFTAASPEARVGLGSELVLASDQFMIVPAGRIEEAARARAAGEEVRTVIAGYPWFTDWGRDTMISLEGLSLATGRYAEARWLLRTFAQYTRDGLIPNMFPEGEKEGLYHTADATLWMFHALDRYLEVTGDRETLGLMLPVLSEIVAAHLRGTHFGIGVDPQDGLLRQGAEGFQLTWMDAKVGDWVVTPRRGKAVEINALWYNALSLLARWFSEEADGTQVSAIALHADSARRSFNERFWYREGGYLYDVIDGENGDDAACRPNQLIAFSLRYPILNEDKWEPVLKKVTQDILTPFGLRTLSPSHPDYKLKYDGDLRARDAAYHQGTVWAWLIGPFVDAWLRVYPSEVSGARKLLAAFDSHLSDACIGSISEIFDAEGSYHPRGCFAQAWSVAEVLRCWLKTAV
jgi:predicted glycogen debranching enzyme